ncbi:hypothetical protein AtDm6_3215 [Acetobacter tropicalis]|jgi:hypothetical protein|uniref:Uncharacterized protein n=1 Tax=Acetobacter tropicalis TaxID=104102 RepID=A0A094YG86_9PROT|nr:hypothetical protein AtDm6_3215 [Acetobacter tropicalis]
MTHRTTGPAFRNMSHGENETLVKDEDGDIAMRKQALSQI